MTCEEGMRLKGHAEYAIFRQAIPEIIIEKRPEINAGYCSRCYLYAPRGQEGCKLSS